MRNVLDRRSVRLVILTRPMQSLLASLLLPMWAFAQSSAPPLAFDVASVKQAAPPALGRSTRSTQDGIDFPWVTLRYCIVWAYRVSGYQVSGPPWIDELRYDIVAKMAPPPDARKFPAMLQTLLAERFHLRVHREPKEFPGYALMVAAGGPKLSPSVEGAVSPAAAKLQIPSQPIIWMKFLPTGGCRLTGEHSTMDYLARNISLRLGCPVVDLTKLPGNYDFELEFSRDDMRNGNVVETLPPSNSASFPLDTDDPGVSVFGSIQRLGLLLKPRPSTLDVIVVDRAERVPTAN
jgi:uncharacterized protein (TIGR03435 family)